MAGRDARIDPDLLRAIAWQESGLNIQAIGRNDNSYDIGLMQINSTHLPSLMATYGISQQQLLSDICANIYSGAYILGNAFNKWGMTWEAVGAYNAGFARTPAQHKRRMNYAQQVRMRYLRLKKLPNK